MTQQELLCDSLIGDFFEKMGALSSANMKTLAQNSVIRNAQRSIAKSPIDPARRLGSLYFAKNRAAGSTMEQTIPFLSPSDLQQIRSVRAPSQAQGLKRVLNPAEWFKSEPKSVDQMRLDLARHKMKLSLRDQVAPRLTGRNPFSGGLDTT